MLLSLGIISHHSVKHSIDKSLESRLMLAGIVSRNIDYILESNLTRLYDMSAAGAINFKDGRWEPEDKALKAAYEYSIFTDRVFILDAHGNFLRGYPLKESESVNMMSNPYVSRALAEKRPVLSDVFTIASTGRKVVYALVPLKDAGGEVIGLAGGEINPTNYLFSRIIESISSGSDTCMELIDSYGIIISSNKPERILTYSDHNEFLGSLIVKRKSIVGTCHRCHIEESTSKPRTEDTLAFAPLSLAPWGIAIREPQKIVFQPAISLRNVFGVLSIIYIGTALVLSVGLSRSIVRPVQTLTGAAKKIGDGDLSEPVEISSRDEIGTLARSFDDMRLKLAESLDKIQRNNIELERRVLERTMELGQRKRQLASLLNEVIRAQEAERKRIARELHDETSQSIAAVGMSLEIASLALSEGILTKEMLLENRQKVSQLLEDINRIIQDLRPPVLDDLGLESAIRWLLERHLAKKGIRYWLSTNREFGLAGSCLSDEKTELMLFRIIQEAVINISKHAEASNVYVSLSFDERKINVDIEDDGVGFEAEEVLKGGDDRGGFGLLGIRERVELLGGRVDIRSQPQKGTRLTVGIPTSLLWSRDG